MSPPCNDEIIDPCQFHENMDLDSKIDEGGPHPPPLTFHDKVPDVLINLSIHDIDEVRYRQPYFYKGSDQGFPIS
jgi:hypothetical protein